MSRTIDEIMEILGNNYTPEELVDILEISSVDLATEFEENIQDKLEYIEVMISEDLGESDEDY
jgi:hypothetical protein